MPVFSLIFHVSSLSSSPQEPLAPGQEFQVQIQCHRVIFRLHLRKVPWWNISSETHILLPYFSMAPPSTPATLAPKQFSPYLSMVGFQTMASRMIDPQGWPTHTCTTRASSSVLYRWGVGATLPSAVPLSWGQFSQLPQGVRGIEGQLSLTQITVWQMRGGARSPTLTFSSQLTCAPAWILELRLMVQKT